MTSEVKLHRVSDPATADQAKLDVVFIHGLGGHWQETWRAKKGSPTWPELLAADQTDLNVWSLHYPAILGHWRASTAEDQLSTADLVPRIALCMKDEGVARSGGRTCVLVCHSLGGIVAKRLLLHALEQTAEHTIDDSKILGVVFLGTPHRGSAMADWLQSAETAKEVIASVAEKAAEFVEALSGTAEFFSVLANKAGDALFATSKLIEELAAGNPELAVLNGRFNTYWQGRLNTTPLRVRICAETHKLHLIDKLVVDLESADPDLHTSPGGPALPILKLPYNHMGLCKVVDVDSEVNGYLLGLVQECLGDPDSIDLHLPPHRYQAVAAIGRLIESGPGLRSTLIDRLHLSPHSTNREVRDRLVGQADMADSATAIAALSACLRENSAAMPTRAMDKMVGWLMVAGLVPCESSSASRHKIAAFNVPTEFCVPRTGVDAALLEASLSQALRRIPALPSTKPDSGADFSPHIIDAGEVMARDIDPSRLLQYLEKRVVDDVELGPTQPLRVALSKEAVDGASPLSAWQRGDLVDRVHGLDFDGRGIGMDDRVRGSFWQNRAFEEALQASPLRSVLFVIGATNQTPAAADLGQFRSALRQYLKDRRNA